MSPSVSRVVATCTWTPADATFPVGLIRQPAALCRLIDSERSDQVLQGDPYDTVYTYQDPDASPYEVFPDQWQRRRYE